MKVIIEGQPPVEHYGWGPEGTLLLSGGDDYALEFVNETADRRHKTLLEVARLECVGDNSWLFNGESFDALIEREGLSPKYVNLWFALQDLSEDKPEPVGAAWFEGEEMHVLLKRFHKITGNPRPDPYQKALSEKVDNLSTSVHEERDAQRAALTKAQEAASATLEEALKKWFDFAPQGMGENTKARIQSAVRMYSTNPETRSLGKVAKAFGVSRKTVHGWFKMFTRETDYQVVVHRRHESVKGHLHAEGVGATSREANEEESF